MYIGETNPNPLFCLNDQANTAWFTSTRGVWSNQCHWTIMTGATNILHSSGNLCISMSVCLTIKIFGSQYHWFRFYHVAVLTSKTSCLHWWFYKIILVTHFEPFLIEHIAEYFKMQQDLLLNETSDEFVETVHHLLKEMEKDHNIAMRKKHLLGSSIHQERLLTSISLFNYRNLGNVFDKILWK